MPERNKYNEEPRKFGEFLQRILIIGQTSVTGLAVGDYCAFAMLWGGYITSIHATLLGWSISIGFSISISWIRQLYSCTQDMEGFHNGHEASTK